MRPVLSNQLACEVDKNKKIQKALTEAKFAQAAADEKEKRLEDQVEELCKDLSSKEAIVASQEKDLSAKGEEVADLRRRLEDRSKTLADAQLELESKCKLLVEKDAQALALEEKIRKEAARTVANERIRGFLIAKAQVKHLHPNINLDPMGVFKKITPAGLEGLDDPP